jgi:hypothetical protein
VRARLKILAVLAVAVPAGVAIVLAYVGPARPLAAQAQGTPVEVKGGVYKFKLELGATPWINDRYDLVADAKGVVWFTAATYVVEPGSTTPPAWRRLVQFYSPRRRAKDATAAERRPLYELELPPLAAAATEPGGEIYDRERVGVAVPPGDYEMLVVTAEPGPDTLAPRYCLVEKDPKGVWRSYEFVRYAVTVR